MATRSNRRLGILRGQPRRYVVGHNQRIAPPMTAEEHRRRWSEDAPEGVEYGRCWCGCGGRTNLSPQNHAERGLVAGLPYRYVGDHKPGGGAPPYAEQDCGHDTPCWVWQRQTTEDGYGRLWVDGAKVYAHRHYYEQAHGRLPDGTEPDHLCANPPCVRPEHMEPVTHVENVHRGRATRLSSQDVAEIRRLSRETDLNNRAIGRMFGTTRDYVRDIVNLKTRKNG